MLQYQQMKMKRIVKKKEKVHRHRPILRPVVGPCAAASLAIDCVCFVFIATCQHDLQAQKRCAE